MVFEFEKPLVGFMHTWWVRNVEETRLKRKRKKPVHRNILSDTTVACRCHFDKIYRKNSCTLNAHKMQPSSIDATTFAVRWLWNQMSGYSHIIVLGWRQRSQLWSSTGKEWDMRIERCVTSCHGYNSNAKTQNEHSHTLQTPTVGV